MTGRAWAWALGALLVSGAALSAAADNAKQKGGGGGGSSRGGGSSSAGSRHTGGGSNSSARSGGGGSTGSTASSRSNGEARSETAVQRERGSGGSGGAQARRPPVTGAEARHPRPGTGHGYRYPYYSHGYYPYYGGYYPYWGWYGVPYYGYYDPFYWGFGVSYGGGYGYGGGYYPGYQYADAASIRTFVEPEKTKVFVDGAYAGEVDDFDGMFQRLYVSPGRHDVTFKLDGYRSHRVMIYAVNDRTIKIRHNMQKGPGEETVEDLSGGITEPPYRMTDNYPPPRDREEPPPAYEERRGARDEGALRLDVRPDDASVYVDGEFVGSARRAGLVPLPPGRHRLEVVRPGFRTVERDVEIQSGRTETVAIDLQRN